MRAAYSCLLVAAFFVATFVRSIHAQSADVPPAPVKLTAQEDHQRMMDLLGITQLRPGPSGNPNAPDAANTDESRVRPLTTLPELLRTEDGIRVATAEAWWEVRRPEIVELFDREMYGRVPEEVPDVHWEVHRITPQMNGPYAAVVKQVVGRVDNSAYPHLNVEIEMTVATPAHATGPVPIIMEFGWVFPAGMRSPFPARMQDGLTWQQQLLAQGWGYAILVPTSFQADNGAGLTEGIIGLTNKGQPRQPDDWGTLRAWAWGASRALDYLETDPHVDARHVGIEGLSRYGKAALVALAYEPRFAIGFIGSSGAGGAKILRRNLGEQVENLASSAEYHWFAGNFIKYAGPQTVDDLPVDAHQLIALAAPRPVFISVGSPEVEGQWVDGRGMFQAAVYASPVYDLLGRNGLDTDEMPPIETGLLEGEVAFRQHSGGHTTGPNWPPFIAYAQRYLPPGDPVPEWAAIWGTAVQLTEPNNMPPAPGLSGRTLRQVVRPTLGGDRIRVRFSNVFGTAPVTIRAASVAPSLGDGAIDAARHRPLSFLGDPEVTIPAGSSVASDPVDFHIPALEDVAITTYLGDVPPDLTGHPGSRTTSYILPENEVGAASMTQAARTDHWYLITGIDAEREDVQAVVTLGNSITDGRGSGTNKQNRWPDELARRLQADARTRHVSVLNAGIGGNCVLRACLGPSALDRLRRDVLDQNGARWLIVLEGVNDLGGAHPDSAAVTAERLIAAYEEIIERSHARDIAVYGATILPFGGSFYDAPERERARHTVNEWIRTSGGFDAVIDLDAALRDPENPAQLRADAHDGDLLHPNELGHRLIAKAVDLTLFVGSPRQDPAME